MNEYRLLHEGAYVGAFEKGLLYGVTAHFWNGFLSGSLLEETRGKRQEARVLVSLQLSV